MTVQPPSLEGCCVLVVEDEYLLADEVSRALESAGARVLGPAATVSSAMALLASSARVDAAVLDVNLGGETVFPVADALRLRHVPFVFCTGYDDWALPASYQGAIRCEKPVAAEALLDALQR